MSEFQPPEGSDRITLLEGFDAVRQFIHSNYGQLVESSEGLANIVSDIDRSIVRGGFPPDESTWNSWVEACRIVQSRKS